MNKRYEKFLDRSCFYTESEFVQMYGQNYRIFLNHDLLIKDEALFNSYKTSEPLLKSTIQGNQTIVSKSLLLNLLNNEGMYQYLFQNLDNDFGNVVRISLFRDDNKVDSIIISRAVLSDLLLSLPKEELTAKEQMRIALITNVSTMNALRTKYRDDIHFCIIDDEGVSIPSVVLFNVLTMSYDKYEEFITSETTELSIAGKKETFPTRVVAYMIVSFMERERILSKYIIPETVYDRYMSLKQLKNIDFESINKNEKSNDYNQDGVSRADLVTLSDEIEELLEDGIDYTCSNLEIAILKYIKLLSVLEYNQEYYASNVTNAPNSNVEEIKNITLDNNAVLPNDMIVIMSYIFKSLGIKYTVVHQTIAFKYGEYVLELDLSNEALLHDMAAVKMKEPIASIKSVNTNRVTKKKFDELIAKLNYKYLVKESNRSIFNQSLDEYKARYARTDMSRKERLFIFFKMVSNIKLMGTDSVFYQNRLFHHLFRVSDGVVINFVSSKVNSYGDYAYVPITIVSVLNGNDYVHYIIDVNSKAIINNIDTETLRQRFEDKSYGYLDSGDSTVPGIARSKAYVR